MKNIIISLLVSAIVLLNSCSHQNKLSDSREINTQETIYSNLETEGLHIDIRFIRGNGFNHPSFAFWVEDMEGNYIETLFATKSIATGIFPHADGGNGTWENHQGLSLRPSALPVWFHKRDQLNEHGNFVPTPKTATPDAITGATPVNNFHLKTITKYSGKKFRLFMEINQAWDWNEYWSNNKFPNDFAYKSSCQPSLVYAVTIDPNSDMEAYYMNPVGHGHFNGTDGQIYTNLSTLTTALDIVGQIVVTIK